MKRRVSKKVSQRTQSIANLQVTTNSLFDMFQGRKHKDAAISKFCEIQQRNKRNLKVEISTPRSLMG